MKCELTRRRLQALLPLLLVLSAGVSRADDVVLFKNPKPSPELKVTSLDGKPIDLAQLHGKVVLLNFWATWCGPCRMEIPDLEEVQRKYPEQVAVVGLSIDDTDPGDVKQFTKQMKMDYPVAMATPEIQRAFGGVRAVPMTLIIDQQGQIVQKHLGANPFGVFDSEVRALLNLPFQGKVIRIDQMAPEGKIGTTEIPGLIEAFERLTPKQRQKALARLNSESCTCGCDYSLATCRVKDPGCGYSLPSARAVLKQVAAEK